jgi:hypothetical protein
MLGHSSYTVVLPTFITLYKSIFHCALTTTDVETQKSATIAAINQCATYGNPKTTFWGMPDSVYVHIETFPYYKMHKLESNHQAIYPV